MATVEKSISINVPVEKVFSYFERPDYLKCFPTLTEVKVWEPLPNGGHRFQCVHKIGGRRAPAAPIEQTEFVPNRRIVEKGGGSFPKTMTTYTFYAEGDETKVTVRSDITIPIPLLGKLVEAILARRMMEPEAKGWLANLKNLAEGHQ